MKTILAALILLAAVPAHAAITGIAWGGVDKQGVDLFTLTNKSGMEVKITNYGGIITSIRVPSRDGQVANVVEGFDSLEDYTSPGYNGRYGSLIGRFANRLKNNRFMLNGAEYRVSRDAYNYTDFNKPYDERVWTATRRDGDEPQLILQLLDRHGTMGFPGNVHVTVTYTLTKANTLRIAYHAVTDADTVINLTNHAYFNMAGDLAGGLADQLLTINGDVITVGDDSNTPTGEMRAVAGTAFDFRKPTPIGAHIDDPDPLIQRAKGYDQNYAINGKPGMLRFAARLEDPKSGRVLEEWTTQPGVQVYTANYNPPQVGLAKGYARHGAVALESQGFPNAPNIASFPSAVLKPNQSYEQQTEYRFSVAR